jgi:hypothetical protein
MHGIVELRGPRVETLRNELFKSLPSNLVTLLKYITPTPHILILLTLTAFNNFVPLKSSSCREGKRCHLLFVALEFRS